MPGCEIEVLKAVLRGILRTFFYPLRCYLARKRRPFTVCYYPRFFSSSQLGNHYYRAAWYLPFAPAVCEQVIFGTGTPAFGLPPKCPDEFRTPPVRCPEHLQLVESRRDWWRALVTSTVILVWQGNQRSLFARIGRLCGLSILNVETADPDAVEYGLYPSLLWRFLLTEDQRRDFIASNRSRFESIAQGVRAQAPKAAYVFGTGPSLTHANEFTFNGCLTIGCNGLIRSGALMDHIQPHFICAGDPVFHYGVSRHAEQFLSDLVSALRQRRFVFVGLAPYGYTLLRHFSEITPRSVFLDFGEARPNYNLLQDFSAPMLDSVLNILMLPLASTFTRNVHLLGCDGRLPEGENEDFWAHQEDVKYGSLVPSALACHPTFDPLRQKTTYDRYLESVEMTILEGERLGFRYTSLQPSNLKTLNSHYDQPVRCP